MKRSVWLTVCLIAVFVVAGLVLQPSSAYAEPVTYRVHVQDSEGLFVVGLHLEISYWVGGAWGQWHEMDDGEDGDYTDTRDAGYATHWRVRITDAGITTIFPAENPYQPPDTWSEFVWIVALPDP